MQRQHCPDQSAVCPALSTPHGTGHTDVPDVSLTDDDEVYQVPVFRLQVCPGGLVLVCHSEQDVGNAEAVICTLAEEKQAIIIGICFMAYQPTPCLPRTPSQLL